MIGDNVSAIDSSACNVLSGSAVLDSYSNGIRKRYVENGGKWYLASTAQYSYNLATLNCIDVSELSSYAYLSPVYYAIAAMMVLIVYLLFFKTIGKLVSWRK